MKKYILLICVIMLVLSLSSCSSCGYTSNGKDVNVVNTDQVKYNTEESSNQIEQRSATEFISTYKATQQEEALIEKIREHTKELNEIRTVFDKYDFSFTAYEENGEVKIAGSDLEADDKKQVETNLELIDKLKWILDIDDIKWISNNKNGDGNYYFSVSLVDEIRPGYIASIHYYELPPEYKGNILIGDNYYYQALGYT